MTSTVIAPLGRIAKLATVATRYVDTTPAPTPFLVSLYPTESQITIQPSVRRSDPIEVIGSLLIWMHRLSGIGGDWWRTSGGDLHITFTGRGPYGVLVQVYSSFPYHLVRRHVVLARGDHESVTPDELYRLGLELRKGHSK